MAPADNDRDERIITSIPGQSRPSASDGHGSPRRQAEGNPLPGRRFTLFRHIRFDGLAALRAWVLLTVFLAINALALVLILDVVAGSSAMLLFGSPFLVSGLTNLSIVFSERVRFVFINPESAELYESEPFAWLGFLTLVIGIGMMLSTL